MGFVVTTAHHLDIGALTPRSCGIVDAIDAYAEGLQFKAIKVFDRGHRVEPVWQILRDNIRASDLVVGDMEAQVAASRIGAERFVQLIERYGVETFDAASERYELRDDVCGAGKWRGGLGSVRELTSLSDGGGSIEGGGSSLSTLGDERRQ